MAKRKYAGSRRFTKRRRTAAPYRRRRWTTRVASRKGIKRLARQVVLASAESKTKSISHGKSELSHNGLTAVAFINAPTATNQPTQGNGDNQRNGDAIIMRGWRIRCLFGQKFDRPNVTFRVIITAQRPESGVLSYNALFDNVTANGLLDKVNDDRVTILMQKYMKPLNSAFHSVDSGALVAREYTFTRQFWIPRKKTYRYETNGGSVHNDKHIYMYVLPYDAFGTLELDNIAYCQVWVDQIYKDP